MTMVHSDIISFYPMSLSVPGSCPTYFSCLLSMFLVVRVSQTCLIFDDLVVSRLVYFSSLVFNLVATKAWNSGPKCVGQQTSYSSIQLKQIDLLLVLMESFSSFIASSFGSPLLYIQSHFMVMVSAK